MNTTTHSIAPEEVMAFVDGELSATGAQAVSAHLDHCAECSDLANRFRSVSQSISRWSVPEAWADLDEGISGLAAKAAAGRKRAKPIRTTRLSFWNWRLWAIGGGGAVAVVLILAVLISSRPVYKMSATGPDAYPATPPAMASGVVADNYVSSRAQDRLEGASEYSRRGEGGGAGGAVGGIVSGMPPPPPRNPNAQSEFSAASADRAGASAPQAPMIARTVSLTILVKDFAPVRAALDTILARHHGYAAQLTVSTAEGAPRSFQASLRIPAPELAAALAEIKSLGRVQNESQSGEEVTQQHADLVARLKNSRETEERMQAILRERTGKIDDVLQVEEEIARVRGEIEGMEAERLALEHRVDFATVDLQLTEEYKAQLNSQSASVSNRMHNALVAGVSHVAETVLGIVLFLEEFGPVLLVWVVILGLPVVLVWRRYRRMKARI